MTIRRRVTRAYEKEVQRWRSAWSAYFEAVFAPFTEAELERCADSGHFHTEEAAQEAGARWEQELTGAFLTPEEGAAWERWEAAVSGAAGIDPETPA
ncbi:MAG TPA: hypothetical protein VGW38_04600, partial [Chloroflexota bacterium]|nr:hypothetical protein [Chloroflexota bacterium]